ncbi:MAG: hypothetical protein ABI120_24610, partial [Gemmatimonadaceae bacterium]
MNAHDRLRLYLEQRRELGESELVLDGLPVDAVLKMIGAPGKTTDARASSSQSGTQASSSEPTESARTPRANSPDTTPVVSEPKASDAPAPVARPPVDPAPRFDSGAKVDWRAALSGLAPGADQKSAPSKEPDR